MAVLSLGGIVASESIRIGGVRLDHAISEFIRRKYGLAVGERTSEDIKIRIGSAVYLPEKLVMEIKGRDMVTGLPKILEVTSDDVTEAIQNELEGIVATVKDVLHKTPPELSADVMEKGIVLSGGTSQLRNLDQLISEATGVPVYVAEDPQLCVAKGTGVALENLEAYKKSIFTS
jgi:rod shape-determining protein MreB